MTDFILTERAVYRATSAWYASRNTGRRLRWAREQAGLSRAELAEFAGMSASTLARVEAGERALYGRERAAVARGLGVSVAFLTARSIAMPPAGTNGNGRVAA
jgi:transcriptional regulator with XRE-family HTH domain